MEKSPFLKKSPEIKSYQFKTLFSKTFSFFWLQYDFIQKRPRKKSPIIVENAWEQRVFAKKGQLILKTPIFKLQMHWCI